MRGSPFGPPRMASPAIAASTVCEYDCVPVGMSVYSRRSRGAAGSLACACACGRAACDLAGGSAFLHAVATSARTTTMRRRGAGTGGLGEARRRISAAAAPT